VVIAGTGKTACIGLSPYVCHNDRPSMWRWHRVMMFMGRCRVLLAQFAVAFLGERHHKRWLCVGRRQVGCSGLVSVGRRTNVDGQLRHPRTQARQGLCTIILPSFSAFCFFLSAAVFSNFIFLILAPLKTCFLVFFYSSCARRSWHLPDSTQCKSNHLS